MIARQPPLLVTVQRVLERTYRMRSGIDDPGRFIIGDHGFTRFYRDVEMPCSVSAASGEGATTIVRDSPTGPRVAVYLPDRLVATLERFPPQCGVFERNVDAFATLVEELDHLLLIAERAAVSRPVTMFELELHANVSKHLVLTRYLAGARSRLAPAARRWLRHHLFDKVRYSEPDPSVRQRYRDARRWAVRLIDGLAGLDADDRIGLLRRFHREPTSGKLSLIARLAA
ncbi:MAG TPA: hypothetical protein VD788_02215 [Candidatus Polarisedimenticolaceae bacterium]|nr:hypothetical protein [Candidatus Polarisedimenticolaceae bacterium]